jgi:hypothetical protein
MLRKPFFKPHSFGSTHEIIEIMEFSNQLGIVIQMGGWTFRMVGF